MVGKLFVLCSVKYIVIMVWLGNDWIMSPVRCGRRHQCTYMWYCIGVGNSTMYSMSHLHIVCVRCILEMFKRLGTWLYIWYVSTSLPFAIWQGLIFTNKNYEEKNCSYAFFSSLILNISIVKGHLKSFNLNK